MAEFHPTSEQLEALTNKKCNMLVSAGAGSGKTRVLTQRILNHIINGIDVERLLVLTFTKNAAAEMKNRVRSGLLEHPELKDQLLKVETAPITNFDSFALSFVKKYYYLLNIDKNIDIGDSSFFLKKTRDFLREIFDSYYEEDNQLFYDIIKTNGERDDDRLFDSIINMYSKLSLKSNFNEYLNNLKDNNFKIKSDEELYRDFMNTIYMPLHNFRDIYLSLGDDNKYLDNIHADELILLEEYDDLRAYFDNYPKFTRQPRNCDFKEDHGAMKVIFNNINKLLKYSNKVELIDELTYSSKQARFFYDVLTTLDKKVMDYKKSINTFDFIDIAKMSIQILKENPIIRKDNINKYYEILVDEYQDTSDVQEEFINLLSNNNIYMVGDIKQSIYRFRNANCDIFKDKYLRYGEGDGGVKIDMTYNFRSREEVINHINCMFDKLMNLDYGGADYVKSHHMKAGNNSYKKEGKKEFNDSLVVLNFEVENPNKKWPRKSDEAYVIACDIKDKIEKGYKVFDGEKLRPATYSDFAIISSTNGYFSTFKEVFDYMKVPLQVYQNESVTKSSFINVINSLLLLYKQIYEWKVKTPEFRHAFMSVGRSLLFDYNDQDLFDYIMDETYFESDIFTKMDKIIKENKNDSNIVIFNKILEEYDVYNRLTNDDNVSDANTTVEFIINKIGSLESANLTFIEFIDYISCLISEEYKMEYEGVLETSDSVVLMNIHKSKGLEYKIIYYFDLDHSFNLQDLYIPYNFDENYGFMINHNGDSPLKDISKYYETKEEISEKIRLFYVALTRAREAMIFVTSKKIEKENISDQINDKSFFDFLCRLKPYLENNNAIIEKNITIPVDFLSNKIIDTEETSAKLTKKEVVVNSKDIESTHASNIIKEVITKKTYDILHEGSKFHEILESLDLHNPDFSNIDEFYVNKIKAFLNQVDVKDAVVYQEHEFYMNSSNKEVHGIIDLLLEYEDKMVIIDYKLQNASKEKYKEQLETYRKYINSVSSKPCITYLYSLLDEKLVLVE